MTTYLNVRKQIDKVRTELEADEDVPVAKRVSHRADVGAGVDRVIEQINCMEASGMDPAKAEQAATRMLAGLSLQLAQNKQFGLAARESLQEQYGLRDLVQDTRFNPGTFSRKPSGRAEAFAEKRQRYIACLRRETDDPHNVTRCFHEHAEGATPLQRADLIDTTRAVTQSMSIVEPVAKVFQTVHKGAQAVGWAMTEVAKSRLKRRGVTFSDEPVSKEQVDQLKAKLKEVLPEPVIGFGRRLLAWNERIKEGSALYGEETGADPELIHDAIFGVGDAALVGAASPALHAGKRALSGLKAAVQPGGILTRPALTGFVRCELGGGVNPLNYLRQNKYQRELEAIYQHSRAVPKGEKVPLKEPIREKDILQSSLVHDYGEDLILRTRALEDDIANAFGVKEIKLQVVKSSPGENAIFYAVDWSNKPFAFGEVFAAEEEFGAVSRVVVHQAVQKQNFKHYAVPEIKLFRKIADKPGDATGVIVSEFVEGKPFLKRLRGGAEDLSASSGREHGRGYGEASSVSSFSPLTEASLMPELIRLEHNLGVLKTDLEALGLPMPLSPKIMWQLYDDAVKQPGLSAWSHGHYSAGLKPTIAREGSQKPVWTNSETLMSSINRAGETSGIPSSDFQNALAHLNLTIEIEALAGYEAAAPLRNFTQEFYLGYLETHQLERSMPVERFMDLCWSVEYLTKLSKVERLRPITEKLIRQLNNRLG